MLRPAWCKHSTVITGVLESPLSQLLLSGECCFKLLTVNKGFHCFQISSHNYPPYLGHYYVGFKNLLFGLAKARLKLSQRRSLNSLFKPHRLRNHQPTTTGTFKALPGKLQSQFSVCNLTLSKLDKI